MFISFWEPLGFPNREELWKAARAARTTLHMGSILFLSLFRAQDGRLKRMFTTGKGRRMDMNVMDCKRKRAQDWHVARLYSISVSPCFLFPFLDKDELHEVGSFVTCHYIDWDFFGYRAWEVVWSKIPCGLCSRPVLSFLGLLLLLVWSTNYYQLALFFWVILRLSRRLGPAEISVRKWDENCGVGCLCVLLSLQSRENLYV